MSSSYSFGFPELLLSSRLAEKADAETWTYEIALTAEGARQPFLIAAGLEQALSLLEDLAQAATDLALLHAEPGPQRIDPSLDADALARVGAMRFHGDVEAVPEGTVVFAGEPLLRVRAPAAEMAAVVGALAGIVRTQTAIATQVARLRLAAKGKPIYEAAGEQVTRDEALLIARAAQVGGAIGTTHPFAAAAYALPALPLIPFTALVEMSGALRGIAHCGVIIDGKARRNPGAALAALAEAPRALVVDAGKSGLLDDELRSLRARLDEMGFAATRLLAGGVCDELRVGALANGGAPIDGFVAGTALLAGRHLFHEDLLVELVERTSRNGLRAVGRRDGGAGMRAVWRRRESGQFKGDTIQPDTQAPPSGSAPLLVPMMRSGKRLFRAPSLTEVRVLCEAQLSMLDPKVTSWVNRVPYPLTFVADAGPVADHAVAPTANSSDPVEASEPGTVEPTAPKKRLIDEVDDSADFTLVSNAFATVMTEHLGFEAEAAAPEAAAQEGSSEPAAELVDEPAREPEVQFAPASEPLAPTTATTSPSSTAAESAPAVEAAPPVSPLLAAAARLRAMQRGEALPPMPKVAIESAPRPAEEPALVTASAAAPPDNPLLAAAARLRAMRGR